MAHSKARAADAKVTYPPGVKEISDKISKEEMVRRLKVSEPPPPPAALPGYHGYSALAATPRGGGRPRRSRL